MSSTAPVRREIRCMKCQASWGDYGISFVPAVDSDHDDVDVAMLSEPHLPEWMTDWSGVGKAPRRYFLARIGGFSHGPRIGGFRMEGQDEMVDLPAPCYEWRCRCEPKPASPRYRGDSLAEKIKHSIPGPLYL